MKLATERSDQSDGRLLVVSRDLTRVVAADAIAQTLQSALERWQEVFEPLSALYARLNAGTAATAREFRAEILTAPLPRAWQWLDGSAFPSHGELMQRAYDLPPLETDRPLMYQGMSHEFLGATEDVPFPAQADGIDFECEIGVLTDRVPMGTAAPEAGRHIRLLVQINDWSLRALAPAEMKTGFGWIQAKPACSMAPVAITPDEVGPLWKDCRLAATVEVWRGQERYGAVATTEMAFGFDELIAHAARTRMLCAGTVIGSGTVSTRAFQQAGSCCIAERRAIEKLYLGESRTPFLRFGERVRTETRADEMPIPLFGVMEQTVVCARSRG
jgi:fumarylacetoacetate (FAA) hydrolase